jgi:hypothetical protein
MGLRGKHYFANLAANSLLRLGVRYSGCGKVGGKK